MGERRYGDQDYTGTFELTKDKEDIVVTGVLPPGQEATDQRVHGTLSLAIKQLAWLNLKLNQDFIRFKPCFWGDERQQILLRADNTALDEKLVLKHTVDYHVRYSCP
jgi:hypothetical protein